LLLSLSFFFIHSLKKNTGTIQDTILCTNVKVKKGCNIKDSQIGADFEVPEKSKIVSEVRSCKAFCMPGDLPASPVLSATMS
jgi:ADP-glucose pyrophosphorylase